MENNEIMNFEEIEMIDNVEVSEKSGVSTGVAMLIGAGLTLAVGAGVKLVKKFIAKHKANKELRQPEETIEVDFEDVEHVASK